MMRAARSAAPKSSGEAIPRTSSLPFSAFSTIAPAPDKRGRGRPRVTVIKLSCGSSFGSPAYGKSLFPALRQVKGGRRTSSGGNAAGGGRARIEKERLAHHRLHHIGREGLGDEEGRFRPVAGEQPFRVGRDEDHRHLERGEEVVDRVDPRAAVGELDVGEDDAGLAAVGEL